MTTTETRPQEAAGDRRGLRWWKELAYVVAFYLVYSAIRNTFGSGAGAEAEAFDNALRIIDIQEALGLYFEPHVQEAFIGHEGFIGFWNVFYGSAHFVVTIGVMIWLFVSMPDRYARFRNTLGWTTGLALIGFALFPLMPPRLLPASYGFVDTLEVIGGLWSFDSEGMKEISNQYAAMPSLHIGWSTWVALAVVPVARTAWARWSAAVYPVLTLFAIVVTANHYWLDAAGGLAVLGIGYVLGSMQAEWTAGRRRRREASDATA